MNRTILAAVALAVLITVTGCSQDAATNAPAGSSTTLPTKAPTSTPTRSQTALEQAFVLEVAGQLPELALARAELVKSGRTTCQAFRDKPGSVADLVKNATAAGATAEQVEAARVIAIAAIHSLCPDQEGDL